MPTICPECREGKHRNCDGIADLDIDDQPIFCECDCRLGDVK